MSESDKDAERYRWLTKNVREIVFVWKGVVVYQPGQMSLEALNTEIDAAIASASPIADSAP